MPEINEEFARAVHEVLDWMGTTPETAGPALGINSRTLSAMGQGIVPMRSLVIRFAEGVARRCESEPGAPAWWQDIDAWLKAAGYPPRRDGMEAERPGPRPPAPLRGGAPPERRPPVHPAARPADEPEEDRLPASQYYRPAYERTPWGDSFLHIFWLLDPQERKVFQRAMKADYDYKAEAARWKQDLARLTKAQFDRKYGRFRVQGS